MKDPWCLLAGAPEFNLRRGVSTCISMVYYSKQPPRISESPRSIEMIPNSEQFWRASVRKHNLKASEPRAGGDVDAGGRQQSVGEL